MGILALATASVASAQASTNFAVPTPNKPTISASVAATPMVSAVRSAVVSTTTAISRVAGTIFGSPQVQQLQQQVQRPSLATEAAWLQKHGWHLAALVDRYGTSGSELDEQAECIAIAVYHEARGETVEGQLAVAKVIMNRAASGKYPSTWCETVKQPWQFSFVNPRTGDIPFVDHASQSWRKAVGITKLAVNKAVPILTDDVLWYHADYVAPSWGRRLSRVEKIGAHIFYRA
jgi:N-acetylmuramoyl-L-alanine amidase